MYEAQLSRWERHHNRHCRCGQDWLTDHLQRAGLTVLASGYGWAAIVGPGLTEGVDESQLTVNALWEAVTGKPGTQTWHERIQELPDVPPKPRAKSGTLPPRASWRRVGEEWMIRAKDINEGDQVEVHRRDGTSTIEVVAEVLQEDSAGWRLARAENEES